MDLFKCMEAFVLCVNTGSFIEASRSLQTSSQMVTKYISFLEQQLGVKLLHRTTRSQRLTEFGQQYYQRCLAILHDVKATKMLAQQFKDAPYGLLRISAPLSFGQFSLMPFISHFMKHHPHIEIELKLSDRYIDLIKEEFDVAFRMGNLTDSGLIARKLKSSQLIFAASPDYLAQNGVPSIPAELKNHHCLIYQYKNGTQKDNIWSFTIDGKLTPIAISGKFKSNEPFALAQAAVSGLGITMLPEMMLKDFIEQKKLIPILQSFLVPAKDLHIIYTQDLLRLPKLNVFIAAAVDYFSPFSAGIKNKIS